MASSSRVFSQTLRFARNLKNGSSKAQKLAASLHVTNGSKSLSQLTRPAASVCGLLHGQVNLNLKSKIQFAPQQASSSLVTRTVAFTAVTSQASEDSSVASSESGSDSSCEAMEGPHGDDDGLVINSSSDSEGL